ncbi:MAG: sensor histidine kinase [Actinomycetales bacterium]
MSNPQQARGAAERTAAASPANAPTGPVGPPAEPAAGQPFAAADFTARRRGPVRQYFYRHPRVMDLAVLLSYLCLAAPSAVPEAVGGSWLHVAACAVTAVLLMFRRFHPVAITAAFAVLETAVLIFSPVGTSVGLSLWFGLYAVAVRRGPVFSFATMAATSLPPAVVFLFFPQLPSMTVDGGGPDRALVGVVSTLVLLISNLIATGVGVSVRRGRQHDGELRAWAERNARMASLSERNRIAREMHDVVAHSLTVMVALSDGAAVVLKRDPEEAAAVLGELSGTGRTALADMRRVLGVLRQDGGQGRSPLPAVSTLSALLDGFRTAGLPVQLHTSGPPLPRDPAFQLTVYRIVQESLTNVLRYARHVSRVSVEVRHGASTVTLRIADDGRGSLAGAGGAGRGILGMKERASIYAGVVSAGPGANGGWLVEAVLDCPDGTAQEQGES